MRAFLTSHCTIPGLLRHPLSDADLSNADFSEANLERVNFRDANLSEVEFTEANLSDANLEGAFVENAILNHVKLSSANLSHASFTGASLIKADLGYANLSHSFLITTQALGTNFTGATLTGACIEDWNINQATRLDEVVCDYIYLKLKNSQENHWELCERRPYNPANIFAPGEFAQRFQHLLETVDLFFVDGIDWKAFLTSFQELQTRYGDENLAIQGIERKGTTGFEVRLAVLPEIDKAEIERNALAWYEEQLKLVNAQNRAELEALKAEYREEIIEIHKQKYSDILELAKLAATKPVTIEAKAVAESNPKNYNIDQSHAKFGGGSALGDNATQTGGTLNDYSIHIGQNIDDIDRLIASLRETIQHFPTEQKKEAEGELIDLEEDIKTPEKCDPERFGRRLKRIAAAGTAALTISGGAATFSGNLDKFAGNVVELTEKLQVPIEYVQSHLPK